MLYLVKMRKYTLPYRGINLQTKCLSQYSKHPCVMQYKSTTHLTVSMKSNLHVWLWLLQNLILSDMHSIQQLLRFYFWLKLLIKTLFKTLFKFNYFLKESLYPKRILLCKSKGIYNVLKLLIKFHYTFIKECRLYSFIPLK